MRPSRHRRRLDVRLALPPEGGDPGQRLRGDPAGWLPAPARYRGEREWTIPVHGLSLTQDVACRVGGPWSRDGEVWRALSFHPVDDPPGHGGLAPALPAFVGEIGSVDDPAEAATLRLRGRYDPPGGHLGAALDALALRHVAVRTAEDLLADIAERLAAVVPQKG